MSKVKSFSVGEGDMFYIKHNSDSFTTIDCCLDYDEESRKAKNHVLNEIRQESKGRNVKRFISTHPDDDHISGLVEYDDLFHINNFYCVKNKASKETDSIDFERYIKLRNDSSKQFCLEKGCERRWLNKSGDGKNGAGINCLWPIVSNPKYKSALLQSEKGEELNNISPVITYSCYSFKFMWMGDMLEDMQKEFDKQMDDMPTTVVFAPHHGRETGRIPNSLLKKLSPKIIVVGEAPSDKLDYYSGYNTITQNSAGDILFVVKEDFVDIFVSNENYKKHDGLTINKNHESPDGMYYLGSIAR